MTKYPMTLLGAEQLKEELRILKTEKRPRIVKDIADARERKCRVPCCQRRAGVL